MNLLFKPTAYLTVASWIMSNSIEGSVFEPAAGIQTRDDISLCKLPATELFESEGFGSESKNQGSTSTGTLNACMIFIDFPDAVATDTVQSLYDLYIPGAPNWYSNASHGALTLNVDMPEAKIYRMPAKSNTYGFERGLTAETHAVYIQDALDVVGRDISFSDYELLYIVPTKAAKVITFGPTYVNPITAPDGSIIQRTVTFGQDAPDTWGYLAMNHETGHCMGLPDLYPFDADDADLYTRGYDLMGLISCESPVYFVWHQWKLGWVSDDQIRCISSLGTTTHTLAPLEAQDGIKGVVIIHDKTTAVIAEARSKGAGSNNCGGVVVYEVHTDVDTGQGPIRTFARRPFSEACGKSTFDSVKYGISIGVKDGNNNHYDVTVTRGGVGSSSPGSDSSVNSSSVSSSQTSSDEGSVGTGGAGHQRASIYAVLAALWIAVAWVT